MDMHETTAMTGDWIQTYTGKPYWPASGARQNLPVDIHDVAHALALNNRWTGHTRVPYSVAEHCVRGTYIVDARYKLAFLLHDITESVLPDMSRPVKYQDSLWGFRRVELAQQYLMLPQFNLDRELPTPVKEADDAMLMAEYRDLMRPAPLPWAFAPRSDLRYEKRIRAWPWWYAEIRFLARYKELTGEPVWKKYLKLKWEDIRA